MRREKGTLIAVPVDDIESPPPSTFVSVAQSFRQQVYSKLLLAKNNDVSCFNHFTELDFIHIC